MKEQAGVYRRDMWLPGRVSADRQGGHRGPSYNPVVLAIISNKVSTKEHHAELMRTCLASSSATGEGTCWHD